MNGIVTVAMPVYNSINEIAVSVESIAAQTWTGEIELLICDDGSTDGTYEKLLELQVHYPFITLLRNEKNQGRPYSRNRLLENASGEFLTWLDADDSKYPNMIRDQMLRFFELKHQFNSEKFAVFSNYDWSFPERDEFKTIDVSFGRDVVKSLLDGKFGAYLWTMLARTDVMRGVGRFDLNLPRLQDLDFFLMMAGQGIGFHHVGKSEGMCLYNKEDAGRSPEQVLKSFAVIREKHQFLIDMYGAQFDYELQAKHFSVAARFARANGDNDLADQLKSDVFRIQKKL